MKKIFLISLLLFFIKVNLFAWHYEIDDARYAPSDTYENFINPTLDGGVFYITQYGSLNIYSSTIVNNSANNGGAIYNNGGILNIQSGSTFKNNTSHSNDTYTYVSGAIYNNKGIVQIDSDVSFISNNIIDSYIATGGAICNEQSQQNIRIFTIGSNCLFYGNGIYSKVGYGGAIYNNNIGIMEIGKNATFANNIILSTMTYSKNCEGGAIYNNGTIYIGSNAIFHNNTVKSNGDGGILGGAICNLGSGSRKAEIEIDSNVQFTNNSAIGYNAKGGAIYNASNYYSRVITIKDGAVFLNNKASLAGGAIYNGNNLNLIAKTYNIEFTGNKANGVSNAIHDYNGTINLWASSNADIIFNDRITSENVSSKLNINSSTTTLTANGKIILNEDMRSFIGEVYLYGGELKLETDARFFSGTVNLSSGTLNIQNNSIDNNIVIDKLTSTNNVNLNIDVNLKNNSSDYFTINTVNGSINLTSINILDISTDNNEGSIKLFNFNKAPTINILTTAYYNWTEYIFTNTTQAGVLNWTKGETKTFKEIVNINTPNKRSVSLTSNEYVTENLGNLGGTQLTIYGNDKNITGNNVDGIYVGNGKILDIENVNNYNGFNSTYGAIKNEGTLNISGTNFSNNSGQDIINNGVLNLINSNSSFSKGITGTGTINIKNCLLNNATIKQFNILITSSGTLNSNANNIDSNIINNGTLLFNGGTNNNTITGTGLTQIYNDVSNQANITQNILEISANKQLTNLTATITVKESLIINDTAKIINDGKLIISSGTNNGIIEQNSNTSEMSIDKNLINNGTINQNTIRINNKLTNNAEITADNIYINGTFKLGENGNFYNVTNSIINDDSTIDISNGKIKNHNFNNLTINSGKVNLLVDADLMNKQMDTISATNFSGNGNIYIKAINLLSDNNENETTEILFTDNEILKNRITSIDNITSKLYKYDVVYNNGYFNFVNSGKIKPELNPVIMESVIASNVGAMTTQNIIANQIFGNIDNERINLLEANNKQHLYASTANQIFETENKIESGLWLRPYGLQETVKFADIDIDNKVYGTLAGLDLSVGEQSLLSFYLGYAGSEQKYEEIKVNQTGFIAGLAGIFAKENFYIGLTANVIFNKVNSESIYGNDEFDMNMYSIEAKTGYNIKLNKTFILEPNLMLMYGIINNNEYKTIQGAKIDGQNITNIIIEPQLKLKLELENGWMPYCLISYSMNTNEKPKVIADEIEFETDKIDGYAEYGIGINKDFINSHWNFYIQATGRSGGRNGFSGNLGIKYKFGNSNEKLKQLKEEYESEYGEYQELKELKKGIEEEKNLQNNNEKSKYNFRKEQQETEKFFNKEQQELQQTIEKEKKDLKNKF